MSDVHQAAPTNLEDDASSGADLIRAFVAAANTRDVDAVLAFFTPDAQVRDLTGGTATGHEEIRGYYIGLYTAFPDLENSERGIFADHDRVALEWTATGTHLGPMQGFAGTGRSGTIDGTTVFELRDNKIQRSRIAYDAMTLARNLGMMPPAGSRAERATRAMFNARLALRRRPRR